MGDFAARLEGAQPFHRVISLQEPANDLLAHLRADAFQKLQRAAPGDRVQRVGEDSQVGEEILDMGSLHELKTAALDEGNVMARQLQFHFHTVKTPAEKK